MTDVDLRASQHHVTLKATIPFAVLAVIAVICRFISRRIQKLRFEFDDYMSLAGLVFTWMLYSLNGNGTPWVGETHSSGSNREHTAVLQGRTVLSVPTLGAKNACF